MAWVTTSTLNGMTKWHGAGHAAYDEAVTALGAEVTPHDFAAIRLTPLDTP